MPVFVEVKRSKSGDMRRAIVGQLLDYAANGSVYWSIDHIKLALQQQWQGTEAAQDALDAFLQSAELEEVDFWRRVEKNFQEHNLRIVFVADELPRQLCRVIEFLNEQMTDVEVLGIELRQFRTDGDAANALRAIAPSVIGRTSQAEMTKGRVAAEQRSFEALDRVVEEYRRVSSNLPVVDNRSGKFRQIHLGSGIRKDFHYEFQDQVKDGLVCDFHAEVTPPLPGLSQALEVLATNVGMVAGARVQFLIRNGRPALRVSPAKPDDPACVAQTMAELINATREPIEKAIRAAA